MNTLETDVIGGPYIERENGVEQRIMSFKLLTDYSSDLFYQRWLWSLSTDELERRKEIVKQQLDKKRSGSILDA